MTVNPQDVLIAVPVKPFGVAKRRLRPVLDTHQRSQVGKAVAGHVIAQARATGSRVAVVTGDDGVADWANTWGAEVIREPALGGNDDWLITPSVVPEPGFADSFGFYWRAREFMGT